MTSDTETLGQLSAHLRVRRLCIKVLEGPDAGESHVAESDAVTIGTAATNTLRLSDQAVSGFHAEVTNGEGGIRITDCGSTNGVYLQHTKLKDAVLAPGTVVRLGRTSLSIDATDRAVVPLHPHDALGQLRGRTHVMRRLMARVRKAAGTDSGVLIVGESGTGKELIARALHEGGPRSQAPFVTVDCGALAPNLTASELFGHEKGAYTGADRARPGAFERAIGGTLFLDEVGELPAELQTHLLGVLERKRIRRVGGGVEIPVDVRVVSATNRDLRAAVNVGSFRLDLYYRLAVVGIEVPALRDRPDDIPLLVEHFVRDCGYEKNAEHLFPPALMKRLVEHPWPGNVRELRNLVEETITMGEPVRPAATVGLPPTLAADGDAFQVDMRQPYSDARRQLVQDFGRRYVTELLETTGGNVSRAAREACMTRSHLFDLLRKYELR